MQAIYHAALVTFRPDRLKPRSERAMTGPQQDDRRRLMAIMDLGGRQPWGRGL